MPARPNIIVVTTHDTGRHFGCYGVDTVDTPAIDALAANSCRFTNYFATSPVCSASRGAMLTGRYPQSNGLMLLTHAPWNWSYRPGERHLSHILRDAGYYTALFGLQHEASDTSTLGFQATSLERRPEGGRYPAGEVAQALASFLHSEAASRAPFYAQVGFFETHRPFDFGGVQPDASRGVFVPPYLLDNEAARADLAHLQGAVRAVDQAVGTITAALAASGLERDTILIFTVDHGIEFPRAKWFLYDSGIAVALLVRWPGGGIAGGSTCDWLLSNVDLLPTLLDLAGVPIPERVEGRSFAGAFGRGAPTPPRDAIYAMFESNTNAGRCVRTGRLKLIRSFVPMRRFDLPVDVANPVRRATCPVVELFDLAADPHEFHDVAGDPAYAEAYASMSERLWSWLEQVRDPILRGPVPTPYYEMAIAEYRARVDSSE